MPLAQRIVPDDTEVFALLGCIEDVARFLTGRTVQKNFLKDKSLG